jgi:uncharacterized protein DUF4440
VPRYRSACCFVVSLTLLVQPIRWREAYERSKGGDGSGSVVHAEVAWLVQDQEKGHGVASKPQLQVFFSKLETQWFDAIKDRDQAALNLIVSDDFHLWTSAPPGNPVSREQWLVGVFGRRLLSFGMRQLAVRGIGSNIAVVSFVQTETYQQSATPQTEDHFVVDIWINSGNGDTGDARIDIFRRSKVFLLRSKLHLCPSPNASG